MFLLCFWDSLEVIGGKMNISRPTKKVAAEG
jgi:hypothetical protein